MTLMQADRFFESTRGRIVAALRGRRGASAFELATEFALSPNAIRQQLAILERDGLVVGRSVRRGKTKPTLEYGLTEASQRLFPQRYDRMLNAVLREVRAAGGEGAVSTIFDGIAKRSVEELRPRFAEKDLDGAVVELTAVLRERGVDVELERTANGFVIHERTCPYAKTVAEHPEVCSLIHTLLKEVVPSKTVQTESLATGGDECRFEVIPRS